MEMFFKYIALIVIITTFLNCERKFEVPKPNEKEAPNGTVISITSAKAGLDRINDNTVTFFTDQLMEGYVISTDKGGNFFKELVVQNAPKNPIAGIQLLIDERALHERFPLGTKILVQLKGLSVGFGNGVAQLGVLKENKITALPAFLIDKHIFRTAEKAEIIPLSLPLNELTREKESLLVRLENMQFGKELLEPVGKTLAAEKTDQFDGLRSMKNCETDVTLTLCTSTFSGFKTLTLPQKSGTVTGVLGRDFGDDFFVLKMNSATDLNFINETRCDPIFFDCNSHNFKGTTELFNEDFEKITNENKLEPLGWFNINVTSDEKRWTDKKITNVANRVLTLSAFNTKLRPLEAWLITPEIDLKNTSEAFVQFRVRTQFNNGQALKVWVTNNYLGDPLTTDWQLLPVAIPITSSNYKTIKQDISCLTGNIRIGFQYKGYDPVITSTYQIDDVGVYSE